MNISYINFVLQILDKYVIKIFLLFFVLGLVVFVSIFLAVDFMSNFLQKDVSTLIVLKYYAFQLPTIIYQMFPMASLLATVFTLSTLNKSNELVAMFSLSYSLARVSAPILTTIAILSSVMFWVNDRIIPQFNKKKNYIYFFEIAKKPNLYSMVKTNKIWYRSDNILFNIKTLNAAEKKAQGLTLYYFNTSWDLVQLITAKEVLMNNENWRLKQGQITLFTKDSSFPLTKSFSEKSITMDEDIADIQTPAHSSDVLSLRELDKFIDKNKEAGLDTLNYEVDYQGKFSFAFAAFVMSLMGIPFSVTHQRSGGTMINAGKSLGLAFMYWAFYSSMMTLGKHGAIPPLLAVWIPNFVMGGLAFMLLIRLKK
ncbi:MAG: LPS export ABC transporter permease LptG [Bdellovibrionales bacterium]|nr:LPS export ABC transporter permease LptG [Bdellovibrionales bacterium]